MPDVLTTLASRGVIMNENKSVKQKIIDMLHRLPDDIDYDRAIEGIYVLQRYDIAQDEIRRGDVFDDDEVMAELLGDAQETPIDLDAARQS